MIIPIIFLVFSAIFSILYKQTPQTFNEPYVQSILISLSSYVRTFGAITNETLDDVGISSTFFNNIYNIKPEKFETYPLDLFTTSFYISREFYIENEVRERLKLLFKLNNNEKLITLQTKNFNITISKQMLLIYASIKESALKEYFLCCHNGMLPNYKPLIHQNKI